MKKMLFLILLLVCFASMLPAQNFQWATRTGGDSGEWGSYVTTDAFENSYLAGNFKSTVDFDPTTGVFNVTALGLNDVFIRKLDPSGAFLWAKRIGDVNANVGVSSIVTNGSGLSVITGGFSGTVDFDPGSGTFYMNAGSAFNTFVMELDNNGNFVWARCFIDNTGSIARSSAVDNAGNIYTVGDYSSTIDLDPGTGVCNFSITGIYNEPFISKLDANGNFVWAKKLDVPNSSAYFLRVDVDAGNNLYVMGQFSGTIDFDPGPGVYNLNASSAGGFYLKLNANGNFSWVRDAVSGLSMDVTGAGMVYSTGSFWGMKDFDPGIPVFNLTSTGAQDGFVLKLDSSGNFVWARSFEGATSLSTSIGYCIKTDPWDNVFIYGQLQHTVDFNPGVGVYSLTANYDDAFYVKLNANGNFIKAFQTGASGDAVGSCIALTVNGNLYTTGSFIGTVDFDPSNAVFNLTTPSNTGYPDLYFRKFSSVLSVDEFANTDPDMEIFPSPFEEGFSLSSGEKGQMELYDVSGRVIYSSEISEGNNTVKPGPLAAGSYFVRVITPHFVSEKKTQKK
jgi:hypothetical protein